MCSLAHFNAPPAGYALDAPDVRSLCRGIERLRLDVVELRARKLAAVTRQRRLDDRIRGLRTEDTTLRNELDAINSALRLSMREAEDAAKFGGDDVDDTLFEVARQEQAGLNERRGDVMAILDGIQAQRTLADGELEGVNRNVQRMTITANEKEELLDTARTKLGRVLQETRAHRRALLNGQDAAIAK